MRSPDVPKGASHDAYSRSSTKSIPIAWNRLPPVLYVLKRVTAKDAPFSQTARVLAMVIADILDSMTGIGWVHQKTLAARMGTSLRTVQRAWGEVAGVLFDRSFPGQTRGKRHRSARYTLFRSSADPAEFCRSVSSRTPRKARESRSTTCDPGDVSEGTFKGNITGDTCVASSDDISVASGATRMSPRIGENSPEKLRLQAELLQGRIDDKEYRRRLAGIRREKR